MPDHLIQRFVAADVSNAPCNLECSYCYAQSRRGSVAPAASRYSTERIGRSFSQRIVGGRAFIYLYSTGEPFLVPSTVDIVQRMLEHGHVVAVTTNMTVSSQIDKLLLLPGKLLVNLLFFASFHYTELLKKRLLDAFFDNIHKVADAGCSWQVRLCLAPEYVSVLDEIKNLCLDRLGQLPLVTHCRSSKGQTESDEATKRQLDELASSFGSPLHDFQCSIGDVKRREFCRAGEWSFVVNLATGDVQRCLGEPVSHNLFENADIPVAMPPVGHECRLPWCMCGSHFLAWGIIPDFECPSYAEMFGRSGEKSLTDEMSELLGNKLSQGNLRRGRSEDFTPSSIGDSPFSARYRSTD